MNVLFENSFISKSSVPEGLIQSFWSDKVFYLGPDFSLSTLLSNESLANQSPYFFLDARIALLISFIGKSTSLFSRGLGPLAVVACMSETKRSIDHNEDQKKINDYLADYNSSKILFKNNLEKYYDCVVIYGESQIDIEIWNKLIVGGIYILGSPNSSIKINLASSQFNAVGNLWPEGEATEFGWNFLDKEIYNLGFKNFELCKLRKLS